MYLLPHLSTLFHNGYSLPFGFTIGRFSIIFGCLQGSRFGKCRTPFLGFSIRLFPVNDFEGSLFAFLPVAFEVVLLLCGRGLSLDVPTGGACNSSPTAHGLPDVPHSCRSILGFHFPLKNCHIALEIYVVPFSNAKVVGSFRMARLNMFRRKVVA